MKLLNEAICKVVMKNLFMVLVYLFPKHEEIENAYNNSFIEEFCTSILNPPKQNCNIHVDLCESKVHSLISKTNEVDLCEIDDEFDLEDDYQLYGVILETKKLRMIGEKTGNDGLNFGLVVTLYNETMQNFSIHIRSEINSFICIVHQRAFANTYLIFTEPGPEIKAIQTGGNFHQELLWGPIASK